MKLVIATPLYPPDPGGPATYAKLLEEGLPKAGEFNSPAFSVEVVKFGDVRHLPKAVRHVAYFLRVRRALRRADIALALDPVSVGLPTCLAAWSLKKQFVVKIVGDYAWEQGRQRFGITATLDEFVQTKRVPFLAWFLRQVQTGVAKRARRIIVPSRYLKNIVMTWGIPEEKIEVIHNGIRLPATLSAPERPGGFLVVSSGRRVPWKGFEGIERVVASEPGWACHIASGVSREEALGWVSVADVFVNNSTYEGLAHALIEAMMLGTPVVATAAGGNGELVEDGVTGLLVPPGDDGALHAALQEVAGDPAAARSRAAAARERMRGFSVETMLARTSDVLASGATNVCV